MIVRCGAVRVGLLVLLGAAVVAFAGLAPVGRASRAAVPCPAYLLIDSRGSGEDPGKLSPPGQPLADVLSRLLAPEKLKRIANAYPARGGFSVLAGAKLHVPGAYYKSVKSGKIWLLSEIRKQAQNCPATKLVLTGYSQGAQVTGDVLQAHGPFGNVEATVLFGDPYFNGRDPVDRGNPRFRTGVNGGLGERPRFTEAHVRSYCHSNDPVCQNTANPIAGFTWHDNYDKLGEPAHAARIVARWLGVAIPVSLGGVAGAKTTMTPAQVSAAWRVPVTANVITPGGGLCAVADVQFHNRLVVAWFISNQLARLDFQHGAITDRGIHIGSTKAAVTKAYGGQLRRHLHPYSVPNTYDEFIKKRGVYLYFSLIHNRVATIYYGSDFVFAEEGCA